jgi:lysophospholipase L1-like esterase
MRSESDPKLYIRLAIGRVCLLLGGVVFSLVLVEGLLRLVVGCLPTETQQLIQDGPRHQGIGHPYIGHLHTPQHAFTLAGRDFKAVHHVDGLGFRNSWPWPEQAEIAVLGDSLTFGQGVADDQAWPAVLARSLPHRHVVNLGLIGAGPQQYLRIYETFGIPLSPKVLLVGLFLRNDFWDADLFDRWLNSGVGGNYMVWRNYGRPRRIASIRGKVGWNSHLLAKESYLFNLLHEVWGVGKRTPQPEPTVFRLADGTQLQLLPDDLASKTVGAQADRPEFQLVLQALQRIQSIATANGTHPLVILQPSKEEVYLPLLGQDPPDPSAPLRQALDHLGLAYLDLTLAFRQRAAAGERLFFEVDGHPNAAGYALIAELVLGHLKNRDALYTLKDSG